MLNFRPLPLIAAAHLLLWPSLVHADELIIRDFIGVVTVKTNSNQALRVTDKSHDDGPRAKMDIQTSPHRIVLDGNIRKLNRKNCQNYYARFDLTNRNGDPKIDGRYGGYKHLEEYPNIVIEGPEDLIVTTNNVILFSEMGNIGKADLNLSACGKIEIGNIAKPSAINISGSADVWLGHADDLALSISGAGDVNGKAVQALDLAISGAGDVTLDRAEQVKISLSGAGDVEIDHINNGLEVSASGSGDLEFDTVQGDLTYVAAGAGDLEIDHYAGGDIEIRLSGSGDVDINAGQAQWLKVNSSGHSHFEFDGHADNAKLSASGSSTVIVEKVTQTLSTEEHNSANVKVDKRP